MDGLWAVLYALAAILGVFTLIIIVALVAIWWFTRNTTVPQADMLIDQHGSGMQYRHKGTGGVYEVIGACRLQTRAPVGDYTDLVVYRSKVNGVIWARPTDEFFDGRFERVH